MSTIGTIKSANARLSHWIESENFKGWDPFDALNSPLLRRAIFENRRLGQVFVQAFKRSPINFRLLFSVQKGHNPKGMGLFLSSYLRKYLIDEIPAHLESAIWFADWLRENSSFGHSGACWGYNFDWPNRGFFAKAGTPTIVNTAFIGFSFLDFYKYLEGKISEVERERALSLARSACSFMRSDLNIYRASSGEICFSYTPLDHRYVHNANLLGAQLLAEMAVITQDTELVDLALSSVRYSINCQKGDGSWWYGEAEFDHWVDNIHTGFVLVSLCRISESLNADWLQSYIERGYEYWKKNMFSSDCIPKYYPHNIYPIDIHCIAQAIMTFVVFANFDSCAINWAHRIASWGIDNMQDESGYFHYQIHPCYRIRIPYMRWSQAWMQRALTELEYVNVNL